MKNLTVSDEKGSLIIKLDWVLEPWSHPDTLTQGSEVTPKLFRARKGWRVQKHYYLLVQFHSFHLITLLYTKLYKCLLFHPNHTVALISKREMADLQHCYQAPVWNLGRNLGSRTGLVVLSVILSLFPPFTCSPFEYAFVTDCCAEYICMTWGEITF